MMNNQLILSIQNRINRYVKDYDNNRIEKPDRCEICGKTGVIWWSHYHRRLTNLADIYTLLIRRVRCNNCGKTFALIPDFIKKFCRYGIDVIRYALKAIIKKPYEKVVEQLYHDYELDISVVTLWYWQTKYSLTV